MQIFDFRNETDFDEQLCRDIVAYATNQGIRLALENRNLPFLINAIERVPDLGICLDVGHVYFTPTPMIMYAKAFLEKFLNG